MNQKHIFLSLVLVVINISYNCHSQEIHDEKEIFLQLLSKALKETEVKRALLPAQRNSNPNYTSKDIYIYADKIPFDFTENEMIIFNKIPIYFYSRESLFFFNVVSYIELDSVLIKKFLSTIVFSVVNYPVSAEMYIRCHFEFTFIKKKWRITKKEYLHIKER